MTQTEPQFKPGDRFFTHYDMKWGTVQSVDRTYRGDTHGVTGDPLPDTTWYSVKYDNGETSSLDDAHGNWDMARMMPPHIAKRFGYGDDPGAPYTGTYEVSLTLPDCERSGPDADGPNDPIGAVLDFQAQASQHNLFAYRVKQESAPHKSFIVDMSDDTVRELTEKEIA
jgi:hypothetical protein